MHRVNAFIIAGGKSSRMAQGGAGAPVPPANDKAFLPLDGHLLLEHAIHQARVADDIYIVGPKEKYSAYGRVVLDIFPGAGPLGGIHAALKRTRTDLNLMLPVDMPFLKREFLKFLIDTAFENSDLVTVPRVGQRLQPLVAVYRKEFLPLAEEGLKNGERKLDALFPATHTAYIKMDTPEMRQLGFEPSMFDNINSPEDYERAAQRGFPLRKPTRYP